MPIPYQPARGVIDGVSFAEYTSGYRIAVVDPSLAYLGLDAREEVR